jgi:hypothetical protein
MAWIEKRKRGDGGVSARVVWRLGVARGGAYQAETFSAGTDAQNLARAMASRRWSTRPDSGGRTAGSRARASSARPGRATR